MKNSCVHPAGAHPADARPYNFLSLADHTSAKRSPPMPVSFCDVTSSTAPAATAASMALPPRCRISRPACAARGSLVATTPWRASTSERPCISQPWARTPGTALMVSPGFGTSGVGVPNALGDCAIPVTAQQPAITADAKTRSRLRMGKSFPFGSRHGLTTGFPAD